MIFISNEGDQILCIQNEGDYDVFVSSWGDELVGDGTTCM